MTLLSKFTSRFRFELSLGNQTWTKTPLQAGAINHGLSPVTKPNLSPITCHNPTMPSLTLMEAWRHAWEFSMTFMMTASNGTILLATIPNHSSVRTLTSFLNMFRLWSRNSNLDQKLLEA